MSTKQIILKELIETKGTAVSGEALAEKCGVSRTAVWKAINSLREEGCNIEGTTNGGYVLQGNADICSAELIQSFLQDRYPAFKDNHIECFEEIDSTNTYAKHLLTDCGALRNENGQLTPAGIKYHKALIVAEKQTAGRGRSGRTFVSPQKTGIYLSIVYAPEGGIQQPAKLTAFSAVAICRVINRLYGCKPQIKWINDIFLNGKKISGILTEGMANFETGTIESAIIGIGINIKSSDEFKKASISEIAGSIITSDTKKTEEVSRAHLAGEIAGEVLTVLEEESAKVIEEYKELSFVIGMEVEVHSLIDSTSGIYKAKAVDINDQAALIVELPDGTRKELISGEVSLKSSSFTN